MTLKDAKYVLDPAAWLEDLGLITDQDGNPVQLDTAQVEVLRSPHRRIIVNCHRQWGKSTLASAMAFHQACLLYTSPSPRD